MKEVRGDASVLSTSVFLFPQRRRHQCVIIDSAIVGGGLISEKENDSSQTMKSFLVKYYKQYLFFLATVGVAFFVNSAAIKSQPPHASVVEADDLVKSAQINRSESDNPDYYNFPELSGIAKAMIPEPKIYAGSFLSSSPEELLASLHVDYDPKAIVVERGIPSKFGIGYYHVYLFEPQKVYYDYGGSAQGVITTWASSVDELLDQISQEANVAIGQSDIISPPRQTQLGRSDLFVVTITPVQETKVEEWQTLSFKTVVEKDSGLELGKKVIKQAGQKGKKVLTYLVHREMRNNRWVETGRELLSAEVVKEPVDEIIIEGTKVITYGRGKASFYHSSVAAHCSLPFGTKVRVVNLANGKSVVVTIGDRGPFLPGRIIDLPDSAFAEIASLGQGVIDVEVQKYYQGE